MYNVRFFVEKKDGFRLESERFLKNLKNDLKLENLINVRIINCYDIFNLNCSENELDKIKKLVLSEVVTDDITDNFDYGNKNFFAVSFLPGQFEQRADSTIQSIKLICENSGDFYVETFKLIVLDGELANEDIEKIKKYYINPIESCEKNIDTFQSSLAQTENNTEIQIYNNFLNLNEDEIEEFRKSLGLAMSKNDLLHIQNYYRTKDRNPNETELKVFDTYWSDHCRHTTFETEITAVKFPETTYGKLMQESYNRYLAVKSKYAAHKSMTFMDLATIVAKEMKNIGYLDDLEISDENNACSIYIDVDVKAFDGSTKTEKYLLMFKNETHNHPTEIEPFGGASTCLGGAIRDPLSGRAYVYQAIRVSGAADPLEAYEKTLKGKLTQKKITTGAASGYSSYGNQIGLATGLVSEIYHEGYKAKRMEVGAVVAAAPLQNVKREKLNAGDVIILLGGKTGRDGCGGATGSSKEHTEESLLVCGAEVQKGNAPEERKIQRLFRNKEATVLIKKCNDFGAGGVSVAIGELAPGIYVNLNKVPTKYTGLSGTELAISESQERMAVVVAKENEEKFLKLALAENLEATTVGQVIADNKLTLTWNGKNIVDIDRDFLDTNGAKQYTEIEVEDKNYADLFSNNKDNKNLKETWLENISELNQASLKGLVEMFDSTIGAGTVLMPFGGKYQLSPTDVSVSKIPMIGARTNTASAITWGYNPFISSKSQYHGAYYAVIESIAKLVAVGVDYKKIRLSFQEYFEKLGTDPKKWSKPFLALLGAFDAQRAFKTAAIGGKDSMSGTFNEINVPPTLISFAVAVVEADKVISTDFKQENNYIYLFKPKYNDEKLVDTDDLKNTYEFIHTNINNKKIVSAMAIKNGGLAEALSKMSFGNKLGFEVKTDLNLFELMPGAIIVESDEELTTEAALYLGKTRKDFNAIVNEINLDLAEVLNKNLAKLESIFPYELKNQTEIYHEDFTYQSKEIYTSKNKIAKPKVLITAFPGTNCEFDTANIFEENGAETNITLFRNINQNAINESIDEMLKQLNRSQIFVLPGGFSLGDEPDGSGKFISIVLQNERVKAAINDLIARDGLVLGICNGFQALIKSGLLPYGEIGKIDASSPTLTFNKIGRHISQIVKTKIVSNKSPWLSGIEVGTTFDIAVSHGEGRFFASEEEIKKLAANGQIASQYVNFDNEATSEFKFNPNGSSYAIEGILSPDGRVFGKMGHSERVGENIHKNIYGNKYQNIFINGIKYFK